MTPRLERVMRYHASQVFIKLVQAGIVEPADPASGSWWRWPADPRVQALAVNAALDELGVRRGHQDPGGMT
jgi:hypothetical protein